MKKLILVLIALFFSTSAYAQDSWIVQKVSRVKDAVVGDNAESAVQAEKSNKADGERAAWEVSIRIPAVVYPANGSRQMPLQITDGVVFMNMPRGFLSFWGQLKVISDVQKGDKTGSYYDDSWDYKVLAAGAQFYITKQKNYNIAFFAGAGQVRASDGDGNSGDIGMAESWGFKLDIPYRGDDPFGWNFELVYEDMFAENKSDDITKSLGDFGLRSWMVGIRIPL